MRCAACLSLLLLSAATLAHAEEPIEIGSRLELFVDEALTAELKGDAALKVQKPTPQEVVLVTDRPWEGNTCAYYTIFHDGDTFRMYYRGSHFDEETRKSAHPEVVCYAESDDGIHWRKPELDLVEFAGSKQNNIVWDGIGSHCFAVFKDANPDCAPEARYKAVGRGRPLGEKGLYTFQSPDGIHWSPLSDGPAITQGAFDSQNLAFWDPHIKIYREYHRSFRDGVRAIMTGSSRDFRRWTEPVYLKYPGAPKQHLYTNAIRPYERAPHLLIGFPTRYLPDEGQRVEPIFMSSRDGVTFHRFDEAVIPQSAPADREGNRSNYMTWGLVQLPGNDREYSVYATEAYYTGPDSRVRRFTYRVDGFSSLSAGAAGGELVTRPLRFTGEDLLLNVVTREGGSVRVELLDADGSALPGFALNDSRPLTGDEIGLSVHFEGKLGDIAQRPIRIRFVLQEADLFSFRFR